MESLNERAIDNFCQYLRLETVHPNPDYSSAVGFLKKQSSELDLEFNVLELCPDNPIVILKWPGTDPSLKSLVLNSHMDVVPVFPDCWTYPPFSAHIDDDGKIFARGTQDMKCVGIQYLEAIRRIRVRDPEYRPRRNVFVLFVPDEEVGGGKGMQMFVETQTFVDMNIGLVMDEGIASETESYPAFYGDRVAWWVKAIITGNTGHGSQFLKNTAGVKASILLNKFMNFRNNEESRMKENSLTLGDVTTINLTGMSGGVQHNVVPSPFTLNFDIRITPNHNLIEFEKMIRDWAEEAGGGIEYTFGQYASAAYLTSRESDNKWWTTFEEVCSSQKLDIVPQVFPAGTDSRFIRKKGISAIGFSPINKTPILLHDHNEFIRIDTFIRGIEFYEHLITAMASMTE